MPTIVKHSEMTCIKSDAGLTLVSQYSDGYQEQYWYDANGKTTNTESSSSKYDDAGRCLQQLVGNSIIQRVFDDYGNVIAEYRNGSWGTCRTMAHEYRRRADGSVEAYNETRTNYNDYWSWYAAIKQPEIVIDEEYAAKEQARIDALLATRKKARAYDPHSYGGPMISSATLDGYYRQIMRDNIQWMTMPAPDEPPPPVRYAARRPLVVDEYIPCISDINHTWITSSDPL